MKLYHYGMRPRGYSPGCQPKGVINRTDDPTGKYYDIVSYDHELTEGEVSIYSLDVLPEEGTVI